MERFQCQRRNPAIDGEFRMHRSFGGVCASEEQISTREIALLVLYKIQVFKKINELTSELSVYFKSVTSQVPVADGSILAHCHFRKRYEWLR